MDGRLARELSAIAQDPHSGAAELALRATTALQAWLRRHSRPSQPELLEIARHLLTEHMMVMAPLMRLGNKVALAADAEDCASALARTCNEFRRRLTDAPRQIAQRFRHALHSGPCRTIVTYSYSSTVLRALIHSRNRIHSVICSEGRPDYEGRITATKLARAGLRVTLVLDAALPGFIRDSREFPCIVVTGADAIGAQHFVNKTGTSTLLFRARDLRQPFWILADSLKLIPDSVHGFPELARLGSTSWKDAPANVTCFECILSSSPLDGARLLTERGWMTPGQVRREMKKIRVSARLKTLVD